MATVCICTVAESSVGIAAQPACEESGFWVSIQSESNTVATSIKRTVTNFKVIQLVPIFRLLLN